MRFVHWRVKCDESLPPNIDPLHHIIQERQLEDMRHQVHDFDVQSCLSLLFTVSSPLLKLSSYMGLLGRIDLHNFVHKCHSKVRRHSVCQIFLLNSCSHDCQVLGPMDPIFGMRSRKRFGGHHSYGGSAGENTSAR